MPLSAKLCFGGVAHGRARRAGAASGKQSFQDKGVTKQELGHEGKRGKEGRQRPALQAWLTRLIDAMHGRIHGFNVAVAHVWAEQEHLLEKAGQSMPVEDSYLAATARCHGLTIVTGKDKDFRRPGLKVFNPFNPNASSALGWHG